MSGDGTSDGPPTSAVLMSTSKHIAIRCGKANKAYLDCKRRDKDPQACLSQGDGVTRCVIDMLKDLSGTCSETLKPFYECMDYYSNNFEKCRDEQAAFEKQCPP